MVIARCRCRPSGRAAVGVDAVAVLVDVAAGQRAAVDRDEHLAAGGLGQGQHRGQAGALRAGKAGALLGAVVVGEDGDFVVGSERALNRAQRLVHLGHHVGGQALIDDKGDGEREGVDGEEAQRLPRVVFIDFEVAAGEAGDQLPFGVLDGDRDFDEVDLKVKHGGDFFNTFAGRGHLGRSGLESRPGWKAHDCWERAALLGGSSGGRTVGSRLLCSGAEAGRDGAAFHAGQREGAPGAREHPALRCCWATAAVFKIGLKLRSAASAIAVKPSFTVLSSKNSVSDQWSVVSSNQSLIIN